MNTIIETKVLTSNGVEHLTPNRREIAPDVTASADGLPSTFPAETALIQGSASGLQYTTGGGNFLVQLGWDGGFQTTGYSSVCVLTNATGVFAETMTTGMHVHMNVATRVLTASLLIIKVDETTNTYVFRINCFYEDGEWAGVSAGSVALAQPASRVRLLGSGGSTYNHTSLSLTYQ